MNITQSIAKLGLTIALLCLMLCPGRAATRVPAVAKVTLVALLCTEDIAQTPVLSIESAGGLRRVATGVRWRSSVKGVANAEFLLSPGHYEIWLQTTHCNEDWRLTVLPDNPRYVTLVMARMGTTFAADDVSLSGLLPLQIDRVSLVSTSGEDVAYGAIDGRAYYFEYLSPGKYFLRLEIEGGSARADIPLDLGAARRSTRRDISAEEFRNYLGLPQRGLTCCHDWRLHYPRGNSAMGHLAKQQALEAITSDYKANANNDKYIDDWANLNLLRPLGLPDDI